MLWGVGGPANLHAIIVITVVPLSEQGEVLSLYIVFGICSQSARFWARKTVFELLAFHRAGVV